MRIALNDRSSDLSSRFRKGLIKHLLSSTASKTVITDSTANHVFVSSRIWCPRDFIHVGAQLFRIIPNFTLEVWRIIELFLYFCLWILNFIIPQGIISLAEACVRVLHPVIFRILFISHILTTALGSTPRNDK